MLPTFQRLGIAHCWYEMLAMFVSVVMPFGPRCFKCKLVILSGPAACEFLSFLIMLDVSCGVAKYMFLSRLNLRLSLYVCLSATVVCK